MLRRERCSSRCSPRHCSRPPRRRPTGRSRSTTTARSCSPATAAPTRSPASRPATSIRFTRFGGARARRRHRLRRQPGLADRRLPEDAASSAVELNLGGGDDVASVASAVKFPVFFNGGSGNDGLFGGGGLDSFDGGPGNDNIVARDNRAESVECASGIDTAITDDADKRVSCEQVEGDADGDGVRRPPTATTRSRRSARASADFPDDGIDQDCSGADATDLDRDRGRLRAPAGLQRRERRDQAGRARDAGQRASTRTATARSSRSRRSPAR